MLKTNDVENFIYNTRSDIDKLSSTDSLPHFSKCESFADNEFNAVLIQKNFSFNDTNTYTKITFSTKKPSKIILMKYYEMIFKINYNEDFFEKIYKNEYLSIFGYDSILNEITCFAVINIVDRFNAEILSLGVLKEYQGKRIGSKMLNKVLEELTNMGINRVRLIVSASNNVAIKLYKRFGFIIEDEDLEYYKGLDEESRKAYFMLKEMNLKKFWIFEVFRRIAKKVITKVSCNLFIYN
jgi:ribosomal protein S18 acetylase RimI-like enzyme